MSAAIDRKAISGMVKTAVLNTPVLDVHTHIFDANFGNLLLWGIDDLLTYHYLIAEVFRVAPMPYEKFWSLNKKEQADYIWHHLFLERSPISEACRGVVTCIQELGLDPGERNLEGIRSYFRDMKAPDYIDFVFSKSNIRKVVMTNDPFDDTEREIWNREIHRDSRFSASLRIDRLLLDWKNSCAMLKSWGYEVENGLGPWTLREIRRFLMDWAKKMGPVYMAASLPPAFSFPEKSPCGIIIEHCVLPVGREINIPFAMMIGVKKLVNPNLRLAGDSLGKCNIAVIERLCSQYPENRFLVTLLSRENQHELCVTARKFPNLMIFGCWWFLNNPSIIGEITGERIELLGLSMVPQHSDARVLDQLLYKWRHSRMIIGNILAEKYLDLAESGWKVREEDVSRDVQLLFGKIFEKFVA